MKKRNWVVNITPQSHGANLDKRLNHDRFDIVGVRSQGKLSMHLVVIALNPRTEGNASSCMCDSGQFGGVQRQWRLHPI